MSDEQLTFSGDALRFTAQTREIRGDTTAFIDLFQQMARRHPDCRITYDEIGGVAIRFEGDWASRLRVLPLTPPRTSPLPPAPHGNWFTRLFLRKP